MIAINYIHPVDGKLHTVYITSNLLTDVIEALLLSGAVITEITQ